MGKLIQLLAIAALFPTAAFSQSAESFNAPIIPKEANTKGEKTEEKDTKPEPEAGPVPDTPSRYASADPAKYIASLSAVFSIRSRATDPFGQAQDPTAKTEKPKPLPGPIVKANVLPSVKFSEVVTKIPVTTVIPGEAKFLVGSRSFLKGDKFPVRFGGKNYPVEVVEVSARSILFRNLENNETASLSLAIMPQGMTKGSQGILAPGMQPPRADNPLEIEADPSSLTQDPAPLRSN